jgi:Leucine-rich repeat (LRR) protein
LKTLSISSNALTSIPAENIEGLVNLEDFNCRKNALTVLPTSLTKLKKLRKLDAGENKLETLFDPEF